MKLINPILHVFISNKQFIVIFLTGLAITALISSSFSLTNYYLLDLSRNALSGLNYHLILYIEGEKHPWNTEKQYNDLIRKDLVMEINYVYVEAYYINKTYIEINNRIIDSKTRLLLIYIPDLRGNYLYSLRGIVRNKIASICGISFPAKKSLPNIVLRIINKTYSVSYISSSNTLYAILDNAYGISSIEYSGLGKEYVNPYRDILTMFFIGETRILKTSSHEGENLCPLILLSGNKTLYRDISITLAYNNMSSAELIVNDIIYENNFYEITQKYIERGKVLLPIIYFDLEKLMIGFSLETTVMKIDNYIRDLKRDIGVSSVGIASSPIYIRLENMRGSEQIFRYSTIISILPSFLIIWLTASKTPPVIIAVSRKTIALLRIRGVSLRRIKYMFTLSLLLWLIPGGIAGFLVGPIISNILYRGEIDLANYILTLETLADPLTMVIVLSIAVLLMIGAVRTGFKSLERISPREFMKPTLLAETPLVERGLSKTTILLLILSAYYVLRILVINPYKIMAETQNPGILLVIASIIMIVLEPIILLFGPVILIYGVAKLMISYPDKIGGLASRIASLFTRRYRALVARFIEIKPARIALTIVLSSFALSLLLGGLAGIDSIKSAYSITGSAVHGDIDYLIARPVLLPSGESGGEIFTNLSIIDKYVNGTYAYGVILLGVSGGNVRPVSRMVSISFNGTLYIVGKTFYTKIDDEKIPLGYILFLSKNFMDIVSVPSSLGIDNDFSKALRDVLEKGDRAIYVYNSVAEEETGYKYSVVIPHGYIDTYIGDNHVDRYIVTCSSRNLPVVGGLQRLNGIPIYHTSIRYSDIASIPLYAPYERGLITSLNELSFYTKTLKNFGKNTFLFGYFLVFVKGEIIESSKLIRKGYMVIPLNDLRNSIDNVESYMSISLDFTVSMGVSLFLVTLVVLSLISYSIIYENLYSYTLMRGRGVSSREVYGLSIAEAFSIAILSILPGLFLGLFLGYGLPALSTQSLTTTRLYIDNAYGVSLLTSLTPRSIVVVSIIFVLPIIISWIIVHLTYRRVVREALILIS